MEKRHFMTGEVLFSEGEIGDEAYIIVKGEVVLSRGTDHSAYTKTIATLGEGDIVGEISLISDQRHSVTAVAASDVETMVLTEAEFDTRMKETDRVMRMILKAFAKKLRSTYNK